MIGLVDYDISNFSSSKFIIPNLEIMKLATYYKTEENRFCRLLSLDEEDLSGYEKIYFFMLDWAEICPISSQSEKAEL